MKPWLFIHIPRTGGSSIREQIGYGASEDREHLPIEAYETDGTTVFSIVRNPFDRAVSLCAAQPHRDRSVPLEIGEFEQWVSEGFPYRTILNSTPYVRSLAAPIVSFIKPEQAAFLGEFEYPDTTAWCVQWITGIRCDNRHVGGTRHQSWQAYYRSAETVRRVVDHYSEDFEEFRYPCVVSPI